MILFPVIITPFHNDILLRHVHFFVIKVQLPPFGTSTVVAALCEPAYNFWCNQSSLASGGAAGTNDDDTPTAMLDSFRGPT